MQRATASFGSLKTLIFACKTNSSTLKNTTQNAPKPTILRAKIKKISGEADPSPGGSPHLSRLRRLDSRACSARTRRRRRLVFQPPNFFYLAPPMHTTTPLTYNCSNSSLSRTIDDIFYISFFINSLKTFLQHLQKLSKSFNVMVGRDLSTNGFHIE